MVNLTFDLFPLNISSQQACETRTAILMRCPDMSVTVNSYLLPVRCSDYTQINCELGIRKFYRVLSSFSDMVSMSSYTNYKCCTEVLYTLVL